MFYICSTLSLLKLRGFSFQILFPGPIGRCYLTRWSISAAPAVGGTRGKEEAEGGGGGGKGGGGEEETVNLIHI